jgi:predicted RNase H-like HicB family nuclease
MKYAVIFEQGPTSVGATVPDVPGCFAVAGTLEGARTLIAEAIEFHIEGMLLDGEQVPHPSSIVEFVEVPVERLVAT